MSADLVIEHEGDTWRVIGQGATRPGQRYCHLASTTRGRQQRNGTVWVQVADWIDDEILAQATAETAAPPRGNFPLRPLSNI